MPIDFDPFFKQYEALAKMADEVFERVKNEYPEEVTCKVKCADCCHALFDLTLVEAMYINHHFNRLYEGQPKEALLDKANKADRMVYKLKRDAYKAKEAGKSENDIVAALAEERIRCPLLNEQDQCDMYDHRPITCRLYGIPTAIGGAGHTCGFSGFEQGKPYPTVNLDRIHARLYELSEALQKAVKSRHATLATLLVPLSMALLTEYDETYLGVREKQDAEEQQGAQDE